MQMREDEITNMYRLAKHKTQQIRILAELNACSEDEIKGILVRKGHEIESDKPCRGRPRLK